MAYNKQQLNQSCVCGHTLWSHRNGCCEICLPEHDCKFKEPK